MANKRETTQKVFRELIDLQLQPHGKAYKDVVNEHDWYMNYRTTREVESEFMKRGIELIRKKLRLSKAMAEREMNWFILQWGLTTVEQVEDAQQMLDEIRAEAFNYRVKKTNVSAMMRVKIDTITKHGDYDLDDPIIETKVKVDISPVLSKIDKMKKKIKH